MRGESDPGAGLDVHLSESGDAVTVSLAGELDIASVEHLEEELRRGEERGHPWLVIDLRRLQFMDSSGLRVVLRAHQRFAESGRRLSLIPGDGQVRRLLEMVGVSDMIEMIEQPARREVLDR